MNIITKFDLGQTLYPIHRVQRRVFDRCVACHGSGVVVLGDGKERKCPDCFGQRGHHRYVGEQWSVALDCASEVGCIRVQRYNSNEDSENETAYMLRRTGIGSGTLWAEERLFASLQDANDECIRRNQEIEHENQHST